MREQTRILGQMLSPVPGKPVDQGSTNAGFLYLIEVHESVQPPISQVIRLVISYAHHAASSEGKEHWNQQNDEFQLQ